jgi:hypothetical protein
MITYDLNAEDVSNLIKSHLCSDLEITTVEDYALIRSDSDKFYGMVRTIPVGPVVLTGEDHKKITMGATSYDYTSLFIAVTPEGVFQFNLSLLRLEFENYTDHSAGVDMEVADLDVSNGTQILEWYPEFASEDDYIDALMSNGDKVGFDEDDTW